MKKVFSFYHYLWAFLGNIIYGFPSKGLFVVGVTGTKGKSTTLELMSAIMEEAGKTTAVLSSVTRKVGKHTQKNTTGNSMPGRMAIQKFLCQAKKAKCSHVFIEVTSQGVVQHRHKFIDWNVAVFLNLSKEHIESHGSYEAYRKAKLSFFEYVAQSKKKKRIFIVNKDDKESALFVDAVRHNYANSIYKFSKEDFLRKISDYVDITSDKARAKFNEWIFADFNLENAAAATVFSETQNISFEVVRRALAQCRGVAGRLEVIQRKPFSVIVDYAHTPDSLEKVYTVARKDYCLEPTSALIAIVGSAGGGRDKWKRVEMGAIAGKQCNEIVVTNEDPFDENPLEIMNEIKKGVLQSGFLEQNIKMILDRREAIRYALNQAKKGDVVIATGKGSEEWIRFEKGRREPWNEREVFEKELKKI